MAKIIIKRKSSMVGCAQSHDVYMVNAFAGNLKNGGTLEIPVGVGTYMLSFNSTIKIFGKNATFTLVVNEPDEVVELKTYFDINGNYTVKYADNKPHIPVGINAPNNQMQNIYKSEGKVENVRNVTKKSKRNNNMQKRGCGCSLIVIVVIFSVFLISTILGNSDAKKDNLSDVELLMKECEISLEEAEKIKFDFEAVGIEDLTRLNEFEGAGVEGMKSFKYTSTTASGTLIITNDGTGYSTNYISMGSNIELFDSFDGGVIDNISHYYLSEDEQSLYLYKAEEIIKQNLKSPSTAKFPNWYSGSWGLGRKDDVITVSSYVDAQNAFGAVIRSEFVLQFSY